MRFQDTPASPPPAIGGDSEAPLAKRKAPPPPTALNLLSFSPSQIVSYLSDQVPWKFVLRKEIFLPSETLDNPVAVDLVFKQVRAL